VVLLEVLIRSAGAFGQAGNGDGRMRHQVQTSEKNPIGLSGRPTGAAQIIFWGRNGIRIVGRVCRPAAAADGVPQGRALGKKDVR